MPSSLRTFSVFAISESSPITGERGKLQVVALSVSSNLFDPTTQTNQLRLTLELDAVKGLGGASPNHRFFALTARRILDPETLEPLTTVYGVAEIDPGNHGLVNATIVDEWDGTDDSGVTLEDFEAYPNDLSMAVVKLYAGSGEGPTPAWKPSALGLSYEQIREMMMQVGMLDVPGHPVLNVLVDWVRRDVVFVSGPYARLVAITRPVLAVFDPATMAAQTCDQAKFACKSSSLEEHESSGIFPYEGACEVCYEECLVFCSPPIPPSTTQTDCKWPDGLNRKSDPCTYWNPLWGTLPIPGKLTNIGVFQIIANLKMCWVFPRPGLPAGDICTYACDPMRSGLTNVGGVACQRTASGKEVLAQQCIDEIDRTQVGLCDNDPECVGLGEFPEYDGAIKTCSYHCAAVLCWDDYQSTEMQADGSELVCPPRRKSETEECLEDI